MDFDPDTYQEPCLSCDQPAVRNRVGHSRSYCLEHLPKPKEREIGSRVCNRSGYVTLKTTDGLVLEHRYVMEQVLGRPLVKGENVHHLNGDRSDNTPTNLELWLAVQPSGQRVDQIIDYVVQFHGAQVIERLKK